MVLIVIRVYCSAKELFNPLMFTKKCIKLKKKNAKKLIYKHITVQLTRRET